MDFKLQKWERSFTEDVARHADNPKIAAMLRNVFPNPYTYADAEWYVSDCIGKDDSHQLARAITVDGEAVGSIGIFVRDDVYEKSAEIGYWLSEEYWGMGIMSRAIEMLCREAFETFDIVRIFAEPYAHNAGSRRVLEKAGFSLEGVMRKSVCKQGQIYDSCMYALIK